MILLLILIHFFAMLLARALCYVLPCADTPAVPDYLSGGGQRVLGEPLPASSPGPDRRIRGFVALGDSYSAGIGTLVEGQEDACRQGNGAYPFLMWVDFAAAANTSAVAATPSVTAPSSAPEGGGGGGDVDFQWLSCTGAVTSDVLSGSGPGASQLDALNTSRATDLATLSIGGNDFGFFDVMNACVFRFYAFYSGTCETALAAADAKLRAPDFDRRLALVLAEALDRGRWERRPRFAVTVTGYACFFNVDTPACDNATLGVWWGGEGAHLTRPVRRRMNELVVAVNDKLRAGVAQLNARFARPRAFFANYDALFEGHRFCEEGVAEPDYNRSATWFFLPGGPDNARVGAAPTKWRSRETQLLAPDSPLVDAATCLAAAERSGDWGEKALCYMAMAKARDPSLRTADDRVVPSSMWYVPTYYGKTFHPRSLGHEAIRDRIYQVWRDNGVWA